MKRNITWLCMLMLSLAFFIAAVFGFDFQESGKNIIDLADIKAIEAAKAVGGAVPESAGYLKTSYGLMVSGLVITGFTIVMWVVLGAFQKTKLAKAFDLWDQIVITVMVFLSVALMLAGELYFMEKYMAATDASAKFSNFWKIGPLVGMLIFTILPLFFALVPYFVRENRRGRRVAATKGHTHHHHTTAHRPGRKPATRARRVAETETLIIA